MGSRSKVDLAYIAGFLDGDGSLMLQIKKRNDTARKWRFMCTICFYQDSRHAEPLYWIRRILGIGYVSHRNDGMTELRINGFRQVSQILEILKLFVRFKKNQVEEMLRACEILKRNPINKLSESDLRQIVKSIISIQSNNYVAKHKRTLADFYSILGLTP